MRRLAPITHGLIRQRAVVIPDVVRGFSLDGASRIELTAWSGRLS